MFPEDAEGREAGLGCWYVNWSRVEAVGVLSLNRVAMDVHFDEKGRGGRVHVGSVGEERKQHAMGQWVAEMGGDTFASRGKKFDRGKSRLEEGELS